MSSRLVAHLRKGDPVVVMGPTGTPTEIPENSHVLLLGGGLGNAVLFSIAKAMQERGNTVIYFAGYKKGEDLFKREEIEAATDQVVWSTDMGAVIAPGRPQDSHFRGNIVQAMLAYQAGELGRRVVPLEKVDRIIAIGSDRMMAAVKAARHGVLAPHLRAGSHEHRQHQLAHAVHDEGSLRAVPAEARRSGLRRRKRSSSRVSIRTRTWTGWTFRTSRRGFVRTRCRKSSRTCGSIICSRQATDRASDRLCRAGL